MLILSWVVKSYDLSWQNIYKYYKKIHTLYENPTSPTPCRIQTGELWLWESLKFKF
jgi:hypothetical protein